MSDIEKDYRKLVLDPNFIAARGHLATMLERNTALRAENERLRAALTFCLLHKPEFGRSKTRLMPRLANRHQGHSAPSIF